MSFISRSGNAFSRFATSALAEAVKATVTALGSTSLGPVAGGLAGTLSRDLVATILGQVSAVERKLEYLLREPLLSGLALLGDGLAHDQETSEERQARDRLLDSAHVLLTRAAVLAGDSREDALFVRALDCVALTAHGSHHSLARRALPGMHAELDELRTRVLALERQAAQWVEDSRQIDRWLAHDSLAEPSGPIQRLWGRSVRRQAAEARQQAESARTRLEILEGLAALADELNRQPVAAARAPS